MVALALVIGLTRWPLVARLVRIETLALLGRTHLRAAFALGATPLHVAQRHLLPHLAAPLGAAAGIVFGGAILTEAALAFVGLGDPSVTSWGQMIASGFTLLGLGWWLWVSPAAMIVLASGLVATATLPGASVAGSLPVGQAPEALANAEGGQTVPMAVSRHEIGPLPKPAATR
jgi:ABC-type dipeptide/oligopeptide/nickel transport system permease subunit